MTDAAARSRTDEASGVIGLAGGGLRIDDAIQIGVPAGDIQAPQSALLVRGDPAGTQLLQAWQTSDGGHVATAVAVDSHGRLGVGNTDASGMPLAIHYDRIPLYHMELIKQLRSRVAALEEAIAQRCPSRPLQTGTS
jgi:hypothetical protein